MSTYSDGSDPTLVKPSNWNDTHNISYSIKSISASSTLDSTYDYVLVTAGVGGVTITLPTAVGNINVYTIKKVDSAAGIVTLVTTSSQTMDGLLNYYLVNQYQRVTLVSDGANWQIVNNN